MTDLVRAASAWAAEQLSTGALPAQIDIDAITDDEPPARAVMEAIACGGAILDEVRLAKLSDRVDVLVVVPLEVADRLTTESPSIAELVERTWDYGPGREVPGLYIVPRSLLGEYEAVEEYRSDLGAASTPKDFAAYYRCWRSIEDRRRGWEFGRAIYLRSIVSNGPIDSPAR